MTIIEKLNEMKIRREDKTWHGMTGIVTEHEQLEQALRIAWNALENFKTKSTDTLTRMDSKYYLIEIAKLLEAEQ